MYVYMLIKYVYIYYQFCSFRKSYIAWILKTLSQK